MQKGIFIVLEGGEGAGKTTQKKLMQERLPVLFPHREFVFTREPGGSVFAEKIRELIVGDHGKDADGRTMIGLLMASRADHVANLILPALEEGRVVISDRYYGSSYAYQVVAQENREVEEVFWAYASLMPAPDLTLFFDLHPTAAALRVDSRAGDKSHFDARDHSFHTRVREGFQEFFKKNEGIMARIDAERTPEEVWQQTQEALTRHLEEFQENRQR